MIELQNMWKSQKLFNSNFVDFDNLSLKDKQEFTEKYVLHLLSEANSLLDTVNWKMHHKDNAVSVNRENIMLELIDVWKYLLSIGLLWDLTPEEFCEKYFEKSKLVEQRYIQEFQNRSDKEIVICDIDGVLSDYPNNFLNYVKGQIEEKGIEDASTNWSTEEVPQLDVYKYLSGKVSFEFVKECKHQYRSQGESRKERVNTLAREFLRRRKEKGDYIVLLTSRPFDKYQNLYLDTFVWLENNQVPFDMLLNDSKKRDKVCSLLKTSKVKYAIDDDPQMVSNLSGLENLSKIYLIDRPYNRDAVVSEKVEKISLEDLIEKEG